MKSRQINGSEKRAMKRAMKRKKKTINEKINEALDTIKKIDETNSKRLEETLGNIIGNIKWD